MYSTSNGEKKHRRNTQNKALWGKRNIEETHRTRSYGEKETKIGDKTYNQRMTIEAEIKRTYFQIRKKDLKSDTE